MYLEKLRFDGRVALVIGASGGGMGTATSLALAEAGAQVVGVDLDEERLDAIRKQVAAIGGKFHGLAANVLETSQVARVVKTTVDRFGGIDCLANVVGGSHTAGTRPSLRVHEYENEDAYEHMFNLNLRYAIHSSGLVAREMIARGRGGASSTSHPWRRTPAHRAMRSMQWPRRRWSLSRARWQANLQRTTSA